MSASVLSVNLGRPAADRGKPQNTTGIDIQSIVQGFGDGSSTKTTTTTERPVKGSAVSAPSATAASTDE